MEVLSSGRKYQGKLTPHNKMNKDMLRVGCPSIAPWFTKPSTSHKEVITVVQLFASRLFRQLC